MNMFRLTDEQYYQVCELCIKYISEKYSNEPGENIFIVLSLLLNYMICFSYVYATMLMNAMLLKLYYTNIFIYMS